MKPSFSLALMLLGGSLSAQVPTPPTPPRAPAPPVMPAAPFEVSPSFDQAWVTDLSDRFSSTWNTALDYSINVDGNLLRDYAMDTQFADLSRLSSMSGFNSASLLGSMSRPVAWAPNDPADSLYRMARDQFSRGDYRKSAELFKSLPQRYPNSAYVPDAQYWQAFSLYRIGGTAELQEALSVLEARKPGSGDDASRVKSGNGVGRGVSVGTGGPPTTYVTSSNLSYAFSQGSRQTDAAGLAARIASVLSQRGLAGNESVKRALAAAGNNTCDEEEQSVRAEALSALMQNDPETGRQMAGRILGSRDECSVSLRRNAVMLVGSRHDAAAATTLIPVAKSDPSTAVRATAMEYLVLSNTDAGTAAVIDILRNSDDPQLQRAAVSALARSSSPAAREAIHGVIENNSATDALRTTALESLDRDRMTSEDAAWLRSAYAHATSARVRERIIAAVGRAGGDANNQWLLTIVRKDDDPMEARTALNQVGRTVDVATLGKMYDASSQRPIREEVIALLAERKEPEAVDKLVDIAKNGTDPRMRSEAIAVLARSKDPRATKLLLDLVK